MEHAQFQQINSVLALIAKFIEICGVLTMIIGGVVATYLYFRATLQKAPTAYESFRSSLGKAILLGLEFMVAGDIIGTVAVEPSFQSLGVLALIVLIRTFLSVSLEVEINGRWPWSSDTAKP